MVKKILVAVDGSKHSMKALDHAVTLANGTGAELTVLEVIEPLGGQPIYFGYPGYYEIPPTTDDLSEKIANKRLEELLPALVALEGAFHRRIRKGNPADEILHELEDGKYDLAVLGTHGSGAVTRFLIGSVSTRVTLHSPCPVMVIR